MDRTTELNNVLSYIKDILIFEAPANSITIEYLVAALLDNTKCHAHFILEECLISSHLEELRSVYDSFFKNCTNAQISDSLDFNDECKFILEQAEKEAKKSKSTSVGSEHVLLALLNGENQKNEKTIQTLYAAGLSYDLVLSKCVEVQQEVEKIINKTKSKRKKEEKLLRDIVGANAEPKNDNGKLVLQTASNATIMNKYTTNISKLAKEGKLDKLVGRERELNQIIKTLARKKKNNVILVGESGCGKTQICYGLANLIANDSVPKIIEDKEILMLNVASLISGTHLRGMFEERVKTLFDELRKNNRYILLIDNMQFVLKSGSKDNDADISSTLCNILNEGDIRVIGVVTPKAYHVAVESNQAIASKMQKIVIEPLSKEDSTDVLMGVKQAYEDYHNVFYTPSSISSAIKLAERYITDRCLPDSAIDIIDLCGAQAVVELKEPLDIETSKLRLKEMPKLKQEALAKCDFTELDKLCDEENKLKLTVANFNRTYEKEKENNRITITEDDVAQVVSDMCGIPANQLSIDEKRKIANIEDVLKQSIIGQDEAIESICKAIKRNKVGLNNPNKPLLTALCLGQSGTGKCVSQDTNITIRNKKTNEIQTLTILEFLSSQTNLKKTIYK